MDLQDLQKLRKIVNIVVRIVAALVIGQAGVEDFMIAHEIEAAHRQIALWNQGLGFTGGNVVQIHATGAALYIGVLTAAVYDLGLIRRKLHTLHIHVLRGKGSIFAVLMDDQSISLFVDHLTAIEPEGKLIEYEEILSFFSFIFFLFRISVTIAVHGVNIGLIIDKLDLSGTLIGSQPGLSLAAVDIDLVPGGTLSLIAVTVGHESHVVGIDPETTTLFTSGRS